jgi:glycosyltransferase involved in cell wall biosynthesis
LVGTFEFAGAFRLLEILAKAKPPFQRLPAPATRRRTNDGRAGEIVRILLWHGYLLGGTGSNVYTRALAREWSNAGHDVTVVCQERAPELYDLAGATVVRPELPGGLLPVFVLDDYPGLEARLLQDFSDEERLGYVDANAAALRALLPADLVFANHVLMGGPVGAATGARFRVKAHGSELEYSMRGREWLERWGRESLAAAETIFVGSRHIREVLEDVVGHVDRVSEVPPGVDIEEFVRQSRPAALDELLEEARKDPPNPANANERLPDEGNAAQLAAFLAGDAPTVVYFGKLIANKGVQLLLEALGSLDARTVIVGFGDYRAELEELAGALPDGRVLFTGPLEHRHLVHLLPLADVAVVPSIFPEAFGMVAAEAAACGCLPLVARHSGLAEVAAGLEQEYPDRLRHLASFATGDAADLRAKLAELLALPAADREALRAGARRAVETRWSWASVAAQLIAPVA